MARIGARFRVSPYPRVTGILSNLVSVPCEILSDFLAVIADQIRMGLDQLSRNRRLIRASIADMPRSRSGLISLARPSSE